MIAVAPRAAAQRGSLTGLTSLPGATAETRHCTVQCGTIFPAEYNDSFKMPGILPANTRS